ncbi:MAG: hypothetical protein Q8N53_01540 [Longimicrobiales bacterium]|nr:hypothetical protein [Longimicrobiales bacterium]
MTVLEDVLGGLRQLLFPAPLRISVAPWPQGWEEALKEAVAGTVEPRAATRATDDSAPSGDVPDRGWLADLGTGLWRLKQRMLEPGTDRPLEVMRRAFRHLESLVDVARGAGLEIQDHTGAPFHSGMSLQVLAFQPTPGVQREKVAETIKPTIYFNGTMIQMGEVIVATPEVST